MVHWVNIGRLSQIEIVLLHGAREKFSLLGPQPLDERAWKCVYSVCPGLGSGTVPPPASGNVNAAVLAAQMGEVHVQTRKVVREAADMATNGKSRLALWVRLALVTGAVLRCA